MPRKISGITPETARIIVINKSDWTTETTQSGIINSFEVDGLAVGNKIVIARNSFGDISAFGEITPLLLIGDRGVFGGGTHNGVDGINDIEYITISTLGNAAIFGYLSAVRVVCGATSNGAFDRGVWGGGIVTANGANVNLIEYITITSIGDSQNFGNLTDARHSLSSSSNGTDDRGVFSGGAHNGDPSTSLNIIDHITVSSSSNANDFGDLSNILFANAATSNATGDRVIFGGGNDNNTTFFNVIDYVTVSTLGNANDFGDTTTVKYNLCAVSNGSNDRGVFAGGFGSVYLNVMDYVTISSTGDAADFGDLTLAKIYTDGTSNGVNNRGVFNGGLNTGGTRVNIIDYITITTLGDAQDFGDLTIGNMGSAGASNA